MTAEVIFNKPEVEASYANNTAFEVNPAKSGKENFVDMVNHFYPDLGVTTESVISRPRDYVHRGLIQHASPYGDQINEHTSGYKDPYRTGLWHPSSDSPNDTPEFDGGYKMKDLPNAVVEIAGNKFFYQRRPVYNYAMLNQMSSGSLYAGGDAWTKQPLGDKSLADVKRLFVARVYGAENGTTETTVIDDQVTAELIVGGWRPYKIAEFNSKAELEAGLQNYHFFMQGLRVKLNPKADSLVYNVNHLAVKASYDVMLAGKKPVTLGYSDADTDVDYKIERHLTTDKALEKLIEQRLVSEAGIPAEWFTTRKAYVELENYTSIYAPGSEYKNYAADDLSEITAAQLTLVITAGTLGEGVEEVRTAVPIKLKRIDFTGKDVNITLNRAEFEALGTVAEKTAYFLKQLDKVFSAPYPRVPNFDASALLYKINGHDSSIHAESYQEMSLATIGKGTSVEAWVKSPFYRGKFALTANLGDENIVLVDGQDVDVNPPLEGTSIPVLTVTGVEFSGDLNVSGVTIQSNGTDENVEVIGVLSTPSMGMSVNAGRIEVRPGTHTYPLDVSSWTGGAETFFVISKSGIDQDDGEPTTSVFKLPMD